MSSTRIIFIFNKLILFLAVLGFPWGTETFSSCSVEASPCGGLSCCGAFSRAQAQQLGSTSLVAPRLVGS